MEIEIKYGDEKSLKWLKEHDHHLGLEKTRKKLLSQEILISQSGNEQNGFLRFGYFWDEIPFMNMLIVSEKVRRMGIGTKLVRYWENEMKRKNHKMLMTSTLSNEKSQHFYRKLGYQDSGSLLMPNEALEIIFIKKLD